MDERVLPRLSTLAFLGSVGLVACESSQTATAGKQPRVIRSRVDLAEMPTREASSSVALEPAGPPPLDVSVQWDIGEGHDAPSIALAKIRELTSAHEARALRWDIECAPGDHVHRGDEVIARLVESKLRVVALAMPHCEVTDAGVGALMSTNLAPSLESLALEDNRIGRRAAEALARASLPALRTHDLTYDALGPKGAIALAGGGPYSRLEKLAVAANAIHAEGASAIARSTAFPSLRELDLRENVAGDDTAEALASVDHDSLSSVDLAENEIADRGALALARAPWMRGLHAIALRGNDIEDQGALALGAAMPAGSALQLDDNCVSDAGVSAVSSQAKVSLEYQRKPFHRVPLATIHLDPPEGSDLPATVEIAHTHLWSKECGFDYPFFMPYGPPYGNGGGRDFHWADVADMTVSAQFVIANEHPSIAGETRVGSRVVMSRTLTTEGIIIHAEFSFAVAYEAYFRPLARLVFASLRHEK